MGDQDRNKGEAGLCGEYGSGGSPEAVRSPALNLVPVYLYLYKHTLRGDEEVGTIKQYGEEESIGEAVTKVKSQACTWRGEKFG